MQHIFCLNCNGLTDLCHPRRDKWHLFCLSSFRAFFCFQLRLRDERMNNKEEGMSLCYSVISLFCVHTCTQSLYLHRFCTVKVVRVIRCIRCIHCRFYYSRNRYPKTEALKSSSFLYFCVQVMHTFCPQSHDGHLITTPGCVVNINKDKIPIWSPRNLILTVVGLWNAN